MLLAWQEQLATYTERNMLYQGKSSLMARLLSVKMLYSFSV